MTLSQRSDAAADLSSLLFSPSFAENPYAAYARMRAGPPICPSPFGGWFVTRYEDVRAGLRDHRLRSVDLIAGVKRKHAALLESKSATAGATLEDLVWNVSSWLAFLEGPDHARLKSTITGNLKKKHVEALRPYIRQYTVELLRKALSQPRVDFVHDFAHKFPGHVIARLLGLPTQDVARFERWMKAVLPVFNPLLPISAYREANTASVEVLAYMRSHIAERRGNPREDLLSELLGMPDGDAGFSDEEAASTCLSLFSAGVETSSAVLGTGLLALLRNPEQKALLLGDLALIPAAVEELLRYEPPIQFTSRIATESFDWHGVRIAAGQTLHLHIAAANHDPSKFPRADALDIRRDPNLHLTFGGGHHFCVGAPLARVMAQIALEVLFTTVPRVRLSGEQPAFARNPIFRELTSLPLSF